MPLKSKRIAENESTSPFYGVLNSCRLSSWRLIQFILVCLVPIIFLAQTTGQSSDKPPSLTKRSEKIDYFPLQAFHTPDPLVSDRIDYLLSRFLKNMNEPSLFMAANTPGAVSFRLTIIFFPTTNVRIVRLDLHPDGTGELVAKVSQREKLLSQRSRKITSDEVNAFLRLIAQGRFWNLAPTIPEPDVVDGTAWALEAVRDGDFRVAFRRNPDPSCFTQIAKYMLKLAEFNPGFPDYPCAQDPSQ